MVVKYSILMSTDSHETTGFCSGRILFLLTHSSKILTIKSSNQRFKFINLYPFSSNSLFIVYLYLNGGPKNQVTNEYLIPFVTGATLCSISEGNTTIDPILLNSGV